MSRPGPCQGGEEGPDIHAFSKSSSPGRSTSPNQPILAAGTAVVVEGYTDTITAHQAGLTNVVATGGTALTEEHLKTLARITSNVTLAFDSDHAGLQAAERAAELDRAHHGIRLHVARLPEGLDPETCWQTAEDRCLKKPSPTPLP